MATVETRQPLPAFSAAPQDSLVSSHPILHPSQAHSPIIRSHAPHDLNNECANSALLQIRKDSFTASAPPSHVRTTSSLVAVQEAQATSSTQQTLSIYPQGNVDIPLVASVNATVQQSSNSPPKLIHLRDCILDLETEIDTDTAKFWQSEIRDRLQAVFDQLRPNEYTQELMLAAPRRRFHVRPALTKSIVISVWDKDTKAIFLRKCKQLKWLKDLLRKQGLQIIVTVDAVALTANHLTRDASGIESARNVLIPRSPDFSTWCGQKLVDATVMEPTCIIGGVISIDQGYFLLTSGHAFFPERRGFFAPEFSTSLEFSQSGDSTDDSADQSDDESCFPPSTPESSDGYVSVATDLSQEQNNVPSQLTISDPAASTLQRVHVPLLIPNLAESRADPDGVTHRECDWSIIELPSPLHTKPNIYRNPYGDCNTVIAGIAPTTPRSRGEVAIILSPNHAAKGYLSPNPGSFTSAARVFTVQSVSLASSLVPGSSGAWVVQDGLLCGYIIGCRASGQIAFMVPINAIFEDITIATGASSVSVYCPEDIQNQLQPLQAAEASAPDVQTDAVPLGTLIAAVSLIDDGSDDYPSKRRRMGERGFREDAVDVSDTVGERSKPGTATMALVLPSTLEAAAQVADIQGSNQAENAAEALPIPPSFSTASTLPLQPLVSGLTKVSLEQEPSPTTHSSTLLRIDDTDLLSLEATQNWLQHRTDFKRVLNKQTRNIIFGPYKDLLQRLYIAEHRPLTWIMDHMYTTYGMHLSFVQYKRQLRDWGFKRNLTKRDAAFILRLLNRAREEGLTEAVTFAGSLRQREDIVRYILRNHEIRDENHLLSLISDIDETPDHISLVGSKPALEGSALPPTPPSHSSWPSLSEGISSATGGNLSWEQFYVSLEDCETSKTRTRTSSSSEASTCQSEVWSNDSIGSLPSSATNDAAGSLTPDPMETSDPPPGSDGQTKKRLSRPETGLRRTNKRSYKDAFTTLSQLPEENSEEETDSPLLGPPSAQQPDTGSMSHDGDRPWSPAAINDFKDQTSTQDTSSNSRPALPKIMEPFWPTPRTESDPSMEWSTDFTHAALSLTPAVVDRLGDLDLDIYRFGDNTHCQQLNDGSPAANFVTYCLFWLICAGQDDNSFQQKAEYYLDMARYTYVGMLTIPYSPGEECLSVLSIITVLFDSYGQWSRLSELLMHCYETTKKHYGEQNPLTITIQFKMKMHRGRANQPPYDVDLLAKTVADMRAAFPLSMRPTLTARYNLAWAMLENQLKSPSHEPESFEPSRRELLDLVDECALHFGQDRIETIMAAATLARVTCYCGRPEDAVEIMEQSVLPRIRRNFVESHPYVWEAIHRHAFFLFQVAKQDTGPRRNAMLQVAEHLLLRIVQERRRVLGESNPKSMQSFHLLRDVMMAQGKKDELAMLQSKKYLAQAPSEKGKQDLSSYGA